MESTWKFANEDECSAILITLFLLDMFIAYLTEWIYSMGPGPKSNSEHLEAKH